MLSVNLEFESNKINLLAENSSLHKYVRFDQRKDGELWSNP